VAKNMKIFHDINNANILRPTCLTLGVFDGLHRGHQAIMKTVVERAKATETVPTVITFDPHPRSVLSPNNAPPLLQTLDQRLSAFEFLGIKQTIVIRFDQEFAAIDADEFLRNTVYERLRAKEVYLGKGFTFGKNRAGNIELLRKISNEIGFVADEVNEVRLRGQRISSTKIREYLNEGQVNLARGMLGRPYGVEGQIVRGFQRGRTIGFPTANLKPKNRVVPKYGVYATATLIDDVWRRSITNVGVRPTFENEIEPSVETFIFDFDDDLYGDSLRLRFLHRIRDEKKFNGIDELKAQIKRDCDVALNYFSHIGVKNMLKIV
jgi:riboflavin kinase / FMN adenylyltransferase